MYTHGPPGTFLLDTCMCMLNNMHIVMNITQYAAHPHIIIGTQLHYTHTSHELTFTWHIHTLHYMSDYKELHTHTHTTLTWSTCAHPLVHTWAYATAPSLIARIHRSSWVQRGCWLLWPCHRLGCDPRSIPEPQPLFSLGRSV